MVFDTGGAWEWDLLREVGSWFRCDVFCPSHMALDGHESVRRLSVYRDLGHRVANAVPVGPCVVVGVWDAELVVIYNPQFDDMMVPEHCDKNKSFDFTVDLVDPGALDGLRAKLCDWFFALREGEPEVHSWGKASALVNSGKYLRMPKYEVI